MLGNEENSRGTGGKTRDQIIYVVGIGVWWFMSGEPSTFALICAGVVLAYLFAVYCLLSVLVPQPAPPTGP